MKVFTTHLDQNLMIKIINIKKKKNNNDIDTKPPNVFNYLKILSQEAKNLINEIKDADNDIGNGKLLFIGNNREKFYFNTFNKLLKFILAIYDREISLKEAEIKQRDLEKKVDLKFNYKPKNQKEKEEIYAVLMQANDLLEYRNKNIDAFENGTFLSDHLKKQIILVIIMC